MCMHACMYDANAGMWMDAAVCVRVHACMMRMWAYGWHTVSTWDAGRSQRTHSHNVGCGEVPGRGMRGGAWACDEGRCLIDFCHCLCVFELELFGPCGHRTLGLLQESRTFMVLRRQLLPFHGIHACSTISVACSVP